MGSELSYDGQGRIKLMEFTGELNINCEIDWDDGDVWIRHDGPTICSNEDSTPCEDKWPAKRCNEQKKKNRCGKMRVIEYCQKTCGLCLNISNIYNNFIINITFFMFLFFWYLMTLLVLLVMTMRTIMLLILNMSMVTLARISCTRHKSNRQEGNEEFHLGFLRTEDFPPCNKRS